MSFSTKDGIKTTIIESVYNEILSRRSHYYYYISKILPWSDETTPPNVSNTQIDEYETRNQMITAKRISSGDASFVIPRRNWSANVVYDQFDGNYSASFTSSSGATSLKSSTFYVLTDEFNVYKVLSNGNGRESNIKPTGTDSTTTATGDGYIWKYMYTIPLSIRNRFLTDDVMPVQRSLNNAYFSNGQVRLVTIDNAGLGYDNANTTLTLTGDGVGANLEAIVNSNTGSIVDVIVVDPGEGYTHLDIEVVGSGSSANLFPQLTIGDLDTVQSHVELSAIDGAVYSIRVDNVGSSYTYATVRVLGDGDISEAANANAYPVISNSNTITEIIVDDPGFGYTHANVEIVGDGTNANAIAIMSPQNGHGFDAVSELFADKIMFFSTINNERIHDVDVNNDYRQFGIIKNLQQYNGSSTRKFGNARIFANASGTPCFLCNIGTVVDGTGNALTRDTVLELNGDSSKLFTVVEVVSGNNQVLLNNLNNHDIVANTVFYESNTGTSFTVSSVDAHPTINKFSGDLLFIDNRTSVSYSDQQLVTLRTTLSI